MHRIQLLSYSSRGTLMSYGDHSASAASSRTRLLSFKMTPSHENESFLKRIFSCFKVTSTWNISILMPAHLLCAQTRENLNLPSLKHPSGFLWRRLCSALWGEIRSSTPECTLEMGRGDTFGRGDMCRSAHPQFHWFITRQILLV